MKKSKRWISAVVAAVMTCSVAAVALSGCGKKPEPEAPTYTYNEYISRFPSSWSTHNAQSDADMYVQKYTEMGLYAYSLSDDKTTFKFVDEMAVGNPVNVTKTYSGKYGIDGLDAKNTAAGKAWEITLNPDATWENGTTITADDYVWSMERVLSSEMKNNLATTYIDGETAIYNGKEYYSNSSMNYLFYSEDLSDTQVAEKIAEGSLYFSLTKGNAVGGKFTFQQLHDARPANADYFKPNKGIVPGTEKDKDPNARDWYAYLYETYGATANEYGYIKVTSENLQDIKEGMTVFATNLPSYLKHWTHSLSYVFNKHREYSLLSGEKTEEEIVALKDSGDLYFSLTKGAVVTGNSLKVFHDLFPNNSKFFKVNKGIVPGTENDDEPTIDPNARDWYAYLDEQYGATADEYGYIKVTDENYADIKEGMTVLSDNFNKVSTKYLPHWYNTLVTYEYVDNTNVDFESVGIFKPEGSENDKFVIVFSNALTLYQVKNALTNNWIVYKNYYENGYSQQGSLKLTNYGTTSGQYMGYGPYKLKSFEVDKQLVFERNENWYGYKSDKTNYHANEYQTDKIVCSILGNQATALLEFESGNLDNVVLSANDTDKYKFSDYLLKRTASNTWSISFNSDKEKLAALEKDGNNLQILSVPEFRKAISLSIDRTYIGQNIMVGSAAAYSFINSNYFYDMENDPTSIYRNTEQAKKALVKLYEIEYGENKKYATLDDAYKAISGYDPKKAQAVFTDAYNKAIANGTYTDGQNIKIKIYNSASSAKYTLLINYINQMVNAATVDTPLAGKITIEEGIQQSGLGTAINKGTVEARYYSFSGDYANPNGMIANFTDPKNTPPECGFDPVATSFSITADFNGDNEPFEVTMSYSDWQKSIAAGGKYATASKDVKLEILSALEYNLLSGFRTLPLCVGTDVTLRSKKVNYATENANIFVAYGGVRLMTYNYSDAEWAEFCKNSNNLKYN